MNDQDKAEAVQGALDDRMKCTRCGALLERPVSLAKHSSILYCYPTVVEDEHGFPHLQTCHSWG